MGTLERIGPPAPPEAVMAILDRFNREELGNTIEVLVALLDIWDGDPDAEDATDLEDDHSLSEAALGYDRGPGCETADRGDQAYVEWHTMRGSQKGGPNILAGHEDDEEDDAPEEDDGDSAVDDYGCDDINDDREEEHDMECEQMPGDVPMLPVYSAEYNVFTDERVPLGIGNLSSSFVGQDIRSADSGAIHNGTAPNRTSRPGTPV